MNADTHAEIAFADIGRMCERLLKEGTPAAHILTALLIHAAGIAKSGNPSPHNAETPLPNLVYDPGYRSSEGPRPADDHLTGEELAIERRMTTTDQETSMTKEEVRQFLADRKEAGKTIQVENCEFTWCWGQILDPYGVRSLSPEEDQVGRIYFVRSPESRGWVSHYDLPPGILNAFYEALPNLMKQEEERLP